MQSTHTQGVNDADINACNRGVGIDTLYQYVDMGQTDRPQGANHEVYESVLRLA
jgi:hypothetical protein